MRRCICIFRKRKQRFINFEYQIWHFMNFGRRRRYSKLEEIFLINFETRRYNFIKFEDRKSKRDIALVVLEVITNILLILYIKGEFLLISEVRKFFKTKILCLHTNRQGFFFVFRMQWLTLTNIFIYLFFVVCWRCSCL